MSSHNVDEMYVKVGVDTSEYDKKVEELSQSNEKLAEGLEDTEKQFEKTSKSSRENSKDIKGVTGEYQKLATGLGNVLSGLARFGAVALAGTGIAAYTHKVSKLNVELANTAKLHGESYQDVKKWQYTASELGGDPKAMTAAIERIKSGITLLDMKGDDSMIRFFSQFDVPFKDAETGKALPLNEILFNLSEAFQKKDIEDVNQFAIEHGLEGLIEPLLLNTPEKVRETFKKQDDKFIFDDKDIENMREFNNNMAELKNHFDALSNSLVSKLLPSLIETQNGILEFIDQIEREGMKGVADDFSMVVKYALSNKDPEAKELIYKNGEEKLNRWIKEQGYKFLKSDPNNLSKDELEKISLVGTLSDKYGLDNVGKLLRENSTYQDRGMSNRVSLLSLEKTREAIEKGADQIREWDAIKDSLKSDPKLLEMEEGWKRKFNESPLLKGLLGKSQGGEVSGKDVQLELKSGNELSKAGNDWLKKISESPVLKSIDTTLKRAFPEFDTNTYIEGLGYLGSDGVFSDASGDKKQQALSYFMGKGWTKEQAAGIVANLIRESGLDPQAVNPNETDSKGNKFSSYGIAQWNRERLDLFKRKFGKHAKDASFEEQLAFVQYELENTHHRARKALKSSDSVASSTEAITRHYEVPANMDQEISKRQAIARDLVGVDLNAWSNSLRIPNSRNTPAQAMASSSNIEVSIGDVMVQTTAETLSGVGQDMSEAIKARMTLGQLTTGAV